MAFEGHQVQDELTCSFPRGEISVILGGSGVGKTTLLRLIGGLLRPCGGTVMVAGRDVEKLSEKALYAVRRNIGMMFQNGALLDSLTVFENVAFPLREHTKKNETEIAHTVHACLASVGLSDVDHLLPGELSGGMTKRVALARAIIREPSLLLCDEPFSGLDPVSSKRIEILLQEINRERDVTIIAISHDVASTMRMADHVVVLLPDGAIEGAPCDLQRSVDPRVASFLSLDLDPTRDECGHHIEDRPIQTGQSLHTARTERVGR